MTTEQEPVTDVELEAALQRNGFEVYTSSGSQFSVRSIQKQWAVGLKAHDLSNALFEAYHLTKP